ncbi:hypothetical protein Tco_0721660, partial [Tanacetum coccineum]
SHFFNKDLEYLRIRNLEEKKYSTSTTKTRAIRYELYGVEEMVENLWSKSLVAYDKDAAYGISHWGYKRKNKLHHLDGKIQTNLVVALRSIGVNGQKPLTIFYKPKGVIYESRFGNSCLMREDQMCKFGDATLVTVRDGLKTRLTNITVGYDGDMLSRSWSKSDCKQAKSMVKKDSILQAGNPVKEILLNLNLPDQRSILTDSKIHIKMDMEIPGSSRVTDS